MRSFKPPYTIDFSQRDPAAGVDPQFHTRWSPRSFKKTSLPAATLTAIFDAARWAPSCRNEQPWYFLTNAGEADFDRFCNLLVEDNQKWARTASLLGFIVARKHFTHNGRENHTADFDCGAAWLSIALQARHFGLYTHGMGGIKRNEVYAAFGIDTEKYKVICGFALGVLDAAEALPDEYLAGEKPSPRAPLGASWQRGAFKQL